MCIWAFAVMFSICFSVPIHLPPKTSSCYVFSQTVSPLRSSAVLGTLELLVYVYSSLCAPVLHLVRPTSSMCFVTSFIRNVVVLHFLCSPRSSWPAYSHSSYGHDQQTSMSFPHFIYQFIICEYNSTFPLFFQMLPSFLGPNI